MRGFILCWCCRCFFFVFLVSLRVLFLIFFFNLLFNFICLSLVSSNFFVGFLWCSFVFFKLYLDLFEEELLMKLFVFINELVFDKRVVGEEIDIVLIFFCLLVRWFLLVVCIRFWSICVLRKSVWWFFLFCVIFCREGVWKFIRLVFF